MDDDFEAKVEQHKRALIESAATIFAVHKVHGDKISDQTKKSYGRLVDSHLLICGILGRALLRVNGKFVEHTESSRTTDGLFASFVIGLSICHQAIERGHYLQALCLLRQEMETIAGLVEARLGRRTEGSVPQVSVLEKSVRRLYSDLSGAAHLAKSHLVRAATEWDLTGMDLPGPSSGTRYFQVFDAELARRAFGLHLMLMLYLVEELSRDHGSRYKDEGFTEEDVEAIDLTLSLMRIEGVIEDVDGVAAVLHTARPSNNEVDS